jgi:hypothetical protein
MEQNLALGVDDIAPGLFCCRANLLSITFKSKNLV